MIQLIKAEARGKQPCWTDGSSDYSEAGCSLCNRQSKHLFAALLELRLYAIAHMLLSMVFNDDNEYSLSGWSYDNVIWKDEMFHVC